MPFIQQTAIRLPASIQPIVSQPEAHTGSQATKHAPRVLGQDPPTEAGKGADRVRQVGDETGSQHARQSFRLSMACHPSVYQRTGRGTSGWFGCSLRGFFCFLLLSFFDRTEIVVVASLIGWRVTTAAAAAAWADSIDW